MSDVTRLLDAAAAGDPQAAAELLPLVYDELRKLAAARLAAEKPGPDPPADRPGPRGLPPAGRRGDAARTGTAAATSSPPPPRPCAASSSTAARRKQAAQARRRPAAASTSTDADAGRRPPADDLLALDEALDPAGRGATRAGAELVKLRYFAGLSVEEAAAALGVSAATADRHWAYARAWLLRRGSTADEPARRRHSSGFREPVRRRISHWSRTARRRPRRPP